MAVRRPTHHHLTLAARALAVAVVACALLLVAPVRVEGGEVAWGATCAEASTSQATVRIGVVVDFGVLRSAGDPAAERVTCVPVAPGRSGLELLTDAGHDYRLNGSGLLCAIDGLPAGNECGERTSTGSYRYWAYFHGAGTSWSYSGIGPTYYRANADGVEGWHFVEGAGNPSDPPPSRSPANICPVTPPPTAPPTTSRPAPPTTAAPAPVVPVPVPGGAPAPGGAAPSGPGTPSGAPATTTTAPGATPTDGAVDPATGSTDAAADPTVADGGRAEDGPAGSTPDEAAVETDVTVLAAAQVGGSSTGSGGAAPVATIAAVIVVAALGGAAAWRFRSRSDDIG